MKKLLKLDDSSSELVLKNFKWPKYCNAAMLRATLLRPFGALILLISGAVGYLYPFEPRNPLAGTPSSPGTPWPLVHEQQSIADLVSIGTAQEFKYIINVEGCEPLEWATQKYNYEFLFGKYATSNTDFPILRTVYVNVSSEDTNQCRKFPSFCRKKSYESYDLTIERNNDSAYALINATTVWGALRGLETFSQLWFTEDWESSERNFYANVTRISDWPRFPHRGLLIDTARHYEPLSKIVEIMDAMFYNKFNVLHWHITDDQSFPFVSTTFPQLSAKGAYTSRSIYTPEMVQQILHAGRMRGIRILFEFDTPGHTHAIGYGHPELLTPCYGDGETPGTPDFPNHAARENLDPTRESTYTFMRELFTEILDISEDQFIHLGMDEVYYPCWNSSPEIKDFMALHNYTELNEVQGHYSERHVEMISSLGAKSISWQDPIDNGVELPLDVVIQVWKDFTEGGWPNRTQQIIDQGYQVLISAPWYINYIGYGPTWRYYYEFDPVLDLVDLKPGQEEQILGGEACIWAEFVDKTNVVPRLFPFSSAVAERLWSPANSSTTDDAMWRLDEHRCRMLWRGIDAQPILNGFCGPWEVDNDR